MGALGDAEVSLFGEAVLLAVPAYFILQIWLGIRLRGAWRIAALVPLPFAVAAIIWCLIALADGSNLWPLPFILFAPLGTLYLLIVWIMSHMFQPARG